LFTHIGAQTTVSELITDFGRTSNLVASARLSEKADQADEIAKREDIVLMTDRAFFGALKAQAMLRVAQRNLAARRGTEAQINGLLETHERSTLDLGLASGNTVQAQLQLLNAESDVQTAMAALDEVLAVQDDQHYTLQDDTHVSELPPGGEATLLKLAMKQRPDLLASHLRQQAAKMSIQAEADRMRPTISAIGTVGGEPVRPGQYFASSWNGAVGANISIPIFDGLLSNAHMKEARLRAQIADEQDRLLRTRIVRDAKTAWIRADNAFQRLRVTEQMLEQADKNLALAQSQYALGRTSYMELSNAELQQADADVSNTNATYLYQMSEADLRYQIGVAP
jgi:outer membrane protein